MDTAGNASSDTTGEQVPVTEGETYNPWSVVHLVFEHLSEAGLHPVLGETGDPGPPARALLETLGITPLAEGNRQVVADIRAHLEELRTVVFDQA